MRRSDLAALTIPLLLAAVAGWCGENPTEDPIESPTVITQNGVIKGIFTEGIRLFRGIPYARPPIGNLRWRPPVAAFPWSEVLEATSFGHDCPTHVGLTGDNRGEPGSVHGPGYDLWIAKAAPNSDEDCLTLNIWAPPTPVNQAPVMVFISPTGNGSPSFFDGSEFAKRGVIMVSANFRLFTLGVFAHPALRAENNGEIPHSLFTDLDRLAVFHWVQKNIAAFGGDANNVTAFGQSNGGGGILRLMTMPAAEGLFHKAIVQSGSTRSQSITYAGLEKIGIELANIAGLDGANASAAQLRALPVDQLPFFAAGTLNPNLLPENRADAFAKGNTLKIPLMIGGNSWDGSSLRYPPQTIVERTEKKIVDMYRQEGLMGDALGYAIYTDEHVNAPARWYASQQAKHGVPVFHYLFSYILSFRPHQTGAAHGDELPFVFNSWRKIPGAGAVINEADLAMTEIMQNCWIAFARDGIPHCDGVPQWPAYNDETRWTMELNSEPKAHQNYRHQQYQAHNQDISRRWVPPKDGYDVVDAIRAAQPTSQP